MPSCCASCRPKSTVFIRGGGSGHRQPPLSGKKEGSVLPSAYAIQMRVAANEERALRDGDGRVGCSIECVGGQFLEFSARGDHCRDAFFAEEVNLSVGKHGRRGVVARHALLPERFSG